MVKNIALRNAYDQIITQLRSELELYFKKDFFTLAHTKENFLSGSFAGNSLLQKINALKYQITHDNNLDQFDEQDLLPFLDDLGKKAGLLKAECEHSLATMKHKVTFFNSKISHYSNKIERLGDAFVCYSFPNLQPNTVKRYFPDGNIPPRISPEQALGSLKKYQGKLEQLKVISSADPDIFDVNEKKNLENQVELVLKKIDVTRAYIEAS